MLSRYPPSCTHPSPRSDSPDPIGHRSRFCWRRWSIMTGALVITGVPTKLGPRDFANRRLARRLVAVVSVVFLLGVAHGHSKLGG